MARWGPVRGTAVGRGPAGLLWCSVLLLQLVFFVTASAEECLSDTVPLSRQTRTALRQLLDDLIEDSTLPTGYFVNWTGEDGAMRAAFLPRGSRLRGDLEVARRSLDSLDGSIAFDRPARSGLDLDGAGPGAPLRIWQLGWASARVAEEVYRILAEEALRYHVNVSAPSDYSADGILSLAGCRPPGPDEPHSPLVAVLCAQWTTSAHVMLEGWESAQKQWARLPQLVRPAMAGETDYLGLETLFVHSDMVEGGGLSTPQSDSCRPPADFYRSYSAERFPDMHRFFDSLEDVLGNVTLLEDVTPCHDWGVTGDEMVKYLRHTQDSDGLEVTGPSDRLLPKCAYGGRVWLSPACRDGQAPCVPVVTQHSYYLDEAMQHSVFWNMPVAILDLKPEVWLKIGKHLKVILQWWVPDNAFAGQSAITMPYPDTDEHEAGMYRTGQHGDIHKFAWQGLPDVAPPAWTLLERMSLKVRDLNTFMQQMHDGRDASSVACGWVRENGQKWTHWLPGRCPGGTRVLRTGLCEPCPAGTVENSTVCLPCPEGWFAPLPGMEVCQLCPEGSTSSQGQRECRVSVSDGLMRGWSLEAQVASVVGAAVALWAAGLACMGARHRKLAKLDLPDVASMPTGAWILKWVGPHIYGRLVESSADRLKLIQRGRWWPCGSRCGSRRAEKFWIVNASPFVIDIRWHAKWDECRVSLGPETFWKADCRYPRHMHFRVKSQRRPRREWHKIAGDWFEFSVKDSGCVDSAWHNRPASFSSDLSEKHLVLRYESKVNRVPCPEGHGDIKLVQSNGQNLLLIMWSPPHTLRGVPFPEFERFLTEVINDPNDWDCNVVGEKGAVKATVRKRPGSSKRNMYDACQNLIVKKVATYDSSYAELCTNYGPANIFISHVWRETAYNTRSAAAKLKDTLLSKRWESALPPRSNVVTRTSEMSSSRGTSGDSVDVAMEYRVWFCTISNNQSRVSQELGSNIKFSPFAQVLESPSCEMVALISPFRALERKWCNYEFCVAKHTGKPVLMLTAEGIVQAGQVAPKTLNKLSKKVVAFDCERATCTSAKDEELINEAVETFGGWGLLNEELKQIFHQAIDEANVWAKTALDRMQRPGDNADAEKAGKVLFKRCMISGDSQISVPTVAEKRPVSNWRQSAATDVMEMDLKLQVETTDTVVEVSSRTDDLVRDQSTSFGMLASSTDSAVARRASAAVALARVSQMAVAPKGDSGLVSDHEEEDGHRRRADGEGETDKDGYDDASENDDEDTRDAKTVSSACTSQSDVSLETATRPRPRFTTVNLAALTGIRRTRLFAHRDSCASYL